MRDPSLRSVWFVLRVLLLVRAPSHLSTLPSAILSQEDPALVRPVSDCHYHEMGALLRSCSSEQFVGRLRISSFRLQLLGVVSKSSRNTNRNRLHLRHSAVYDICVLCAYPPTYPRRQQSADTEPTAASEQTRSGRGEAIDSSTSLLDPHRSAWPGRIRRLSCHRVFDTVGQSHPDDQSVTRHGDDGDQSGFGDTQNTAYFQTTSTGDADGSVAHDRTDLDDYTAKCGTWAAHVNC